MDNDQIEKLWGLESDMYHKIAVSSPYSVPMPQFERYVRTLTDILDSISPERHNDEQAA